MRPDPIHWPDGKRMALVVTVDFLDTCGILAQEPAMASREKSLSVWRYGAKRGVDRLLGVFDEFKLRTSWFVPGRVAHEHRSLMQRIRAAGHEIGNTGFAAENFDMLSLPEQIESFEKAQVALTQIVGVQPLGFRSQFGNWAPAFADVLRQRGIRWSSSWRGDDRPYFHPPPEASSEPLIELPLHYELEDEPYFTFNLYPPVPAGQPRIAAYREVLANWNQDFAGFRRFGLCLPLRLHPEIIGTAGRIDVLREFLAGALRHADVWAATGTEVTDWWRQQHQANEPGHPVDIFYPLHVAARSA